MCGLCAGCVCGCDWLLWWGVFVLCVLRDEQYVSLALRVPGRVANAAGRGWLAKVGWDVIPLVPVSRCTIMVALPSC